MTRISPKVFLPSNYREMDQLQAEVQDLIEAIIEDFSLRVSWSKFELCTQKEEYPKAFVECFVQTFQRHTALNREAPEHRNLLISALVGNFLPDIKRQIQTTVVGWASQTAIIITEAATQFFEDSLQECKRKKKLKSKILDLQFEPLEKQKPNSENKSRSTHPLFCLQTSADIVKKSGHWKYSCPACKKKMDILE